MKIFILNNNASSSTSSSSSNFTRHMRRLFLWAMLLLCIMDSVNCQDCAKNPLHPACRQRGDDSSAAAANKCDPFYLIQGKSNECSKSVGGNKFLSIDPSTVIITGDDGTDIIKLPGCFTIQFNVEVLDKADLSKSFLAKVSFNWQSLPQFAELPCQNQTSNGCNGYGNNCYYCDMCNNLKKLKDSKKVADSTLSKQFTDVKCPDKPGIYLLKKNFCFKDFKELDKNNNCKLDALEEKGGEAYKKALDNLQLSGYGTVLGKFELATNATVSQSSDLQIKNDQIAANTSTEFSSRKDKSGWGVSDAEYKEVVRKFTKDRQDLYYKKEFLKRLIDENEVACLSVSFTVCDKKPVSVNGQKICPPRSFNWFL